MFKIQQLSNKGLEKEEIFSGKVRDYIEWLKNFLRLKTKNVLQQCRRYDLS